MHSVEKKIYLGLLICLLVSVIGVSFAYFTGSVVNVGNGANSSTLDPAKLIRVKYDAGDSSLFLENAIPGDSISKNFSVTVTPTKDENTATYSINLNLDANTFVKCNNNNYNASTNACTLNYEELVYTLSDSEGAQIATGDLLEQSGNIELAKFTKTVATATTYNYSLTVSFKNTGADQNHNANKALSGNLKVIFAS